jgi:DNA invertase Pin-like site-specific DNA recombinase
MVLVWALDRFTRNGMAATVVDLQRLNSYGATFHSYSEPHLSTDNELVRDVLLAVLASLAKLEREKISQRTKAGLERARARGRRLGRPAFSTRQCEKLRAALDRGNSWHAVSIATGIPDSTVKKHARALGYEPRRRSTNEAKTAHD